MKLNPTLLELISDNSASYTESLTELKGFKVAIDADLLLSKVTSYSVVNSVRDGNASVDKLLEANLT